MSNPDYSSFNAAMPDVDIHSVESWQFLNILVIGDAILDGYLWGHADRLCREAPAPVVGIERRQDLPGGAANTAANLASLGAQVRFLSVVGTDDEADRLIEALQQRGVPTEDLIRSPQRATLAKQRIMADAQILARLDRGSTEPIPAELEQALINALETNFAACDGLVISDYSYGVLTPRLIQTLSDLQAQSAKTIVIDSRRLQAYRSVHATAVKPNYEEALQLLQLPRQSSARVEQMQPYAQALLDLTGAQIVALTLDQAGAIGFERDQTPVRIQVQPVPPNQTSGAGDTFTSALTLALAAGSTTATALYLATIATTVAIQQLETAVCSASALQQSLLQPTYSGKLLLDRSQLDLQVRQYRTEQKRIVFTNGCFDILHSGHVTYLMQAKALGDLLIVGVNSDESVRRLKGADRPVNCLSDRLTVLAALSCIDYLVPFTELNPSNLIRIICPDTYVKGGDYTRETLPETELIEELGGQVVILPYVDNRSTTRLIQQIRTFSY